jgi:integrase
MKSVLKQLRRGEREAASKLPQVIDGDRLHDRELSLKKRPNGVWAVFRGSVYVKSSGTKDEAKARLFLTVYELQLEAREEGIVDPRYVQASEIVAYYLSQIPAQDMGVRKFATDALKRLKPHLDGKRLLDMNGAAIAAIERKLLETYRPLTVHATICAFRTAIRVWSRDHAVATVMPFGGRKQPPGRDRVITVEEQKRVLRWACGEEDYDPETRTWSPARRRLRNMDLHTRLMVGRVMELGVGTGTRPGRLMGLAWGPDAETGHIDVEAGILHRCPIGARVSTRKRAPALMLPPVLLAKVRRWKEEDGDRPYAIRTWGGKPRRWDDGFFFRRALARLGIVGVVRHTMRHTCITRMIEARVPSVVISAVVGVSVKTLRDRYNHSDETVVQPAAHPVMDGLLLGRAA